MPGTARPTCCPRRTPARSRPPAAWRCCCRRRSHGAVEVVTRLDGLIISGGADVDPARYGATPHPRTQTWRPTGTPGSCAAGRRRGGRQPGARHLPRHAADGRPGRRRLEQHLPDVVGHYEHSPARTRSAGSRSAPRRARWCAAGRRRLQVNCHHHQAVVASGFRVTARAADGTIEAIEDPDGRSGWPCSGTPSTATTTACSAGWSAAAEASCGPQLRSTSCSRIWPSGAAARAASERRRRAARIVLGEGPHRPRRGLAGSRSVR